MLNSNADTTLADDMLTGAAEIAEFIGKPQRQTEWLLEKKRLPAFKIGGRWHMRKSTHMAHVARLEAEALAEMAA